MSAEQNRNAAYSDEGEPFVPFLLAGWDPNWTPREPVMFGTRRHIHLSDFRPDAKRQKAGQISRVRSRHPEHQ
jgi:hypothetical protein